MDVQAKVTPLLKDTDIEFNNISEQREQLDILWFVRQTRETDFEWGETKYGSANKRSGPLEYEERDKSTWIYRQKQL